MDFMLKEKPNQRSNYKIIPKDSKETSNPVILDNLFKARLEQFNFRLKLTLLKDYQKKLGIIHLIRPQ